MVKHRADGQTREEEEPRVASLIYGIAPGVQFDTIARSSPPLFMDDEEFLRNIAKSLGSRVQESGLSMAVACRMAKREAVLLSIPVTEHERGSARSGLFATIVVSIKGHAAEPRAFIELLATLDLVIARACRSPYQHPYATAAALTRQLQRDDSDAFRNSLAHAINHVCSIFSALPLDKSVGWFRRIPLRRGDRHFSYTRPGREEPHFTLSGLVLTQMKLMRTDQVGCFIDVESSVSTLPAEVSAFQFTGKGIALCFRARDGAARFLR
jgi:hypothetical protein